MMIILMTMKITTACGDKDLPLCFPNTQMNSLVLSEKLIVWDGPGRFDCSDSEVIKSDSTPKDIFA